MPKQKPTPKKETKRKLRFLDKPSNFQSVYANNVRLGMTNWDFKMEFGSLEEATNEEIVIQPLALVIMSPQHTKAFAAVLVEHIKKYEEAFGEVAFNPKAKVEQP